MNIDWKEFHVFLVTYQSKSFSMAANKLQVSQATVSRRIASLETFLGHSLFDRMQSGLVPTAAAEALYPYAERMAGTALEAVATLQGFELVPEGVVRIAVPPGFTVDFLPRFLPVLRVRYPAIRLDILSDNQMRNIDRYEADIAIRSIRPIEGDLIVRQLFQTQAGLFASPSYLSSLPTSPTIEDLDFISWSEELSHIPLARWSQENTKREPILTTNSFMALRIAAKQGLGVVILPEIQAKLAGLVVVPVQVKHLPNLPTYILIPQKLRQIPRVTAVVDLILEASHLLQQGFEKFDACFPLLADTGV